MKLRLYNIEEGIWSKTHWLLCNVQKFEIVWAVRVVDVREIYLYHCVNVDDVNDVRRDKLVRLGKSLVAGATPPGYGEVVLLVLQRQHWTLDAID